MDGANSPPTHEWTNFFLQHERQLSVYALYLAGNDADAEDLIQEVMLRMIRTRQAPDNALPYVLQSLKHRWIDVQRSAARPLPSDMRHHTAHWLQGEDRDALAEHIRKALAQLPARRHEIIVLKTYCGLTFAQIAELLDRPMGSITSDYARGIATLRQLMQQVNPT